MTDSSNGNEGAKGPGGEPRGAGLTPRAAHLSIPRLGSYLPWLPGPSALGKSSLSEKLGANSRWCQDARGAGELAHRELCPVPLGLPGPSAEKVLIVFSEPRGTLRPGGGSLGGLGKGRSVGRQALEGCWEGCSQKPQDTVS